MKSCVSILLLIALSCFCSCKNTWSKEDKENYMHSCMEGLSAPDDLGGKPRAYCDCMLEKITKKYPNVNDMLEHMQDVVNDPELQQCKENLK